MDTAASSTTHPQDSRIMAQNVIAIASGEAHTLALSGDGSVYSWGRGMFGRLGTGSDADQLFPVKISFFEKKKAQDRRDCGWGTVLLLQMTDQSGAGAIISVSST